MTVAPTNKIVVDVQLDDPHTTTEVYAEDYSIEIVRYAGVVRCGLGTRAWVHPGNVVDATDGAVVYLAPGARLEEPREAELTRGEITVCPWTHWPDIDIETTP